MPSEFSSTPNQELLSPEGLPLYVTLYSAHNDQKQFGFVQRPNDKYLPEGLRKIEGDIFVHDSALEAGQTQIDRGLRRGRYQPDDFEKEIIVLEVVESQNAKTNQPSLKATKVVLAEDYRAYLAEQEKKRQQQLAEEAKDRELSLKLETEKAEFEQKAQRVWEIVRPSLEQENVREIPNPISTEDIISNQIFGYISKDIREPESSLWPPKYRNKYTQLLEQPEGLRALIADRVKYYREACGYKQITVDGVPCIQRGFLCKVGPEDIRPDNKGFSTQTVFGGDDPAAERFLKPWGALRVVKSTYLGSGEPPRECTDGVIKIHHLALPDGTKLLIAPSLFTDNGSTPESLRPGRHQDPVNFDNHLDAGLIAILNGVDKLSVGDDLGHGLQLSAICSFVGDQTRYGLIGTTDMPLTANREYKRSVYTMFFDDTFALQDLVGAGNGLVEASDPIRVFSRLMVRKWETQSGLRSVSAVDFFSNPNDFDQTPSIIGEVVSENNARHDVIAYPTVGYDGDQLVIRHYADEKSAKQAINTPMGEVGKPHGAVYEAIAEKEKEVITKIESGKLVEYSDNRQITIDLANGTAEMTTADAKISTENQISISLYDLAYYLERKTWPDRIVSDKLKSTAEVKTSLENIITMLCLSREKDIIIGTIDTNPSPPSRLDDKTPGDRTGYSGKNPRDFVAANTVHDKSLSTYTLKEAIIAWKVLNLVNRF